MKVSHYQAPGELGVKIVENTLVNIELVRLSLWEQPKVIKIPADSKCGLKRKPFDSKRNTLTHQATLKIGHIENWSY